MLQVVRGDGGSGRAVGVHLLEVLVLLPGGLQPLQPLLGRPQCRLLRLLLHPLLFCLAHRLSLPQKCHMLTLSVQHICCEKCFRWLWVARQTSLETAYCICTYQNRALGVHDCVAVQAPLERVRPFIQAACSLRSAADASNKCLAGCFSHPRC